MALPGRVPCKRDKGTRERDGEGPEIGTAGSGSVLVVIRGGTACKGGATRLAENKTTE